MPTTIVAAAVLVAAGLCGGAGIVEAGVGDSSTSPTSAVRAETHQAPGAVAAPATATTLWRDR